MDYVTLNKSRHAVKAFDGKKIPTVDVKQIISMASLAPSAHNLQPWHFVIVESDTFREALFPELHGKNEEQLKSAGAVIVLFSDTALAKRSQEIARLGSEELSPAELERYNSRYPQLFDSYDELEESNYLSLNIGLVTMNLMYAIKNRGYEGNIIRGFERTSKINNILEVELRYHPELIVTLGTSEDKGHPSYRLPQERIFEIR